MITRNSDNKSLASFIDNVCTEDHFRIETDLGDGFYKLRSSEAERRQAAQDIRSSEDVLIELLRNSRDAGAKHIFVALSKSGNERDIVVLDDGCGIPKSMQKRIFDPRVTSKLDTAHMDKWGMHGRGMALYSIAENSREAKVAYSGIGLGCSIKATIDLDSLSEKTDQSTFPKFEEIDGVYTMRGPKNLLRCVAEFALEHRHDVVVYVGSFTEVASTLYEYSMSLTSAFKRAFGDEEQKSTVIQCLAFAKDPEEFADICNKLAIPVSARSARRIIDGDIESLPSLMERIESESFNNSQNIGSDQRLKKPKGNRGLALNGSTGNFDDSKVKVSLSDKEMQSFKDSLLKAYDDVADAFYLSKDIEPLISIKTGSITVEFPLIERD